MKARRGLSRPPITDSLPLRIYPSAWNVTFVLVSTVGLLAAITTLEGQALAGVVLSVSLATMASLAAWSTVTPMPRHLPVVAGLWATILILVAHGLVTILGPWSLLGLVALCLASPTFVGAVRSVRSGAVAGARARRNAAAAPTAGPAPQPIPHQAPSPVSTHVHFEDPHAVRLLDPECAASRQPDISRLSPGDLAGIWRISGLWLNAGLNAQETAHLARLRASCLDEIERRDPVAFSRWVEKENPWVDESPDVRARDDRDPPPEGAGAS